MPTFTVIDGTKPPDSPAEQVRERVRKTKVPYMPQCHRCGGRETITASIGKTRNKLCVLCLMAGQRMVVE
jgi:transcription elongation factor Elf1